MENLECPQCGNALANGVAVCGACGKEVKDDERAIPPHDQNREKGAGGKKLYAILAVLLVLLGGAALLIFTGLLPNPMKSVGSTAAIVNGEKITMAEVNQKLEAYKKVYGQVGKMDFSSPERKKALDNIRRQIVEVLIQERMLVTEAVKEKIAVSPQEIAAKIAYVKKGLNLSDKDFDVFLEKNGITSAHFEKRIEKDLLIAKLVAKGMQEKGLTKEAWFAELQKRAKVEILR